MGKNYHAQMIGEAVTKVEREQHWNIAGDISRVLHIRTQRQHMGHFEVYFLENEKNKLLC